MTLHPTALLTPCAMGKVDERAIADGTPGIALMERAGQAVARLCLSLQGVASARIFCGPGKNGGDGYVAARYLLEAGWDVDLWSLVDPVVLKGDAAWAAHSCKIKPKPLSRLDSPLAPVDFFIDALFGAGLARPLESAVRKTLELGLQSARTSITIDLPSGISGTTGEDMSGLYANHALDLGFDHCVTFGAHKFGHVLMPGRQACGRIWLADIALPFDALAALSSGNINHPENVRGHAGLTPKPLSHKYQRGHVGVVCGGAGKHGAGALAAAAAMASGAGLVTMMERDTGAVSHVPAAVMRASWPAPDALADFAKDRKLSMLLIGPGLGLDDEAAALLQAALKLPISLVLDADALTLIARNQWHERLSAACVLTPHEGEFQRLFPAVSGTKIERFKAALHSCKASLCLKGADSLIGDRISTHVTVNTNAPPTLATAGSGDVLAGLIAGVWAPDVSPVEALKMAVHLHGLAGALSPSPLHADQLIAAIAPAIALYRDGKSEP